MRRTIIALALSLCVPAALSAGTGGALRRYALVTPEGKTEGKPALDLSDGPKIAVWSGASLPAAVSALEALGRDDAAKAALMVRALFLAPGEDLPALAALNAAGPYEYSVPYSAADWPEIKGAGPRAFFYTASGPVCEADLAGTDPASGFRSCMELSGLLSEESLLDTAVRLIWLNRGDDGEREEAKRLVSAEAAALLAAGGFSSSSAAGMSDAALKDSYRIAGHYNFYGPGKEMIAAQSGLLAELEKRGLADPDMIDDMHGALLRLRMFAEAEVFRLAHPGEKLQVVPRIKGKRPRSERSRAVYFLEKSGAPMLLRGEDMRGDKIIIVASPGCHAADRALEEIEKDRRLLGVFKKHGLPLTEKADFARMGKWNGSHVLKYSLAASREDWPEIDFSLSPTFYFMRDGDIVYRFDSWGPGSMDNVYRGLGYLFYGGTWKGDGEGGGEAPAGTPARREGPLGNFLKGLTSEQKYGFCSGLSYAGGIFAGAPMVDIEETLGEAAAARLRAYIAGPGAAEPPAGAKPGTFGGLLPALGKKELVRTCETISFFDGRFGGLNFSYIWALPDESLTDKVMSFFSPPRPGKK